MKLSRILPLLLAACLATSFVACKTGSRPPAVGQPAPDFTVTSGDKAVTLSQLRGKPVLLNFWATWCPPCVEEMPSLNAFHNKYKDKITVLAVSVDVDDRGYQKFLADNKIDFLTIRDDKQVSNRVFGTNKFPETYLIDADGKLRRKWIGPVDWTSAETTQYFDSL